jgi:hypothetical protein
VSPRPLPYETEQEIAAMVAKDEDRFLDIEAWLHNIDVIAELVPGDHRDLVRALKRFVFRKAWEAGDSMEGLKVPQ